MNNGNINNNNNKSSALRVRAVSAIQPILYDIPFSSIVEAYEDCCRHKRTSADFMRFSCNYESCLVDLWESIRSGVYQPTTSITFIVEKPVKREIFAAAFIDRVVHHWICMRLEPILERRFSSQGNVSKNCRKGEGCQKAVFALYNHIREESAGYTRDAYVFKGDFQSYFMSVSKSLLWEMLDIFIRDHYQAEDIDCLLYLTRTVIFHSPQSDCVRRSHTSQWKGLPPSKSLFHNPPDKGMPIGNLSSQIFANFYGSVFDHYVMEVKGFKRYLRFVDDFVLVASSAESIRSVIPELDEYLSSSLLVSLHPRKRYLQHYSKGIHFVGAFIHAGRIYISRRTLGNLYTCIMHYNTLASEGKASAYAEKFVASLNSYFGLMIHYSTYNLRRKVSLRISPEWWEYIYIEGHFRKFVVKSQYKQNRKMRKTVRKGEY